NTVYIVMEYINGGTLDEHIAQSGKLSEQESVDSILKLCSAVNCMHEHRMLHLDIKPKNVMLDEDGQLYLIDFGLSKQYTANGEPESSTSIGLGTPGYAPVEQAEHQDSDKKFRATIDVYALGATLYKMLTGKTPPKASEILNDDELLPSNLQKAGVSNELAQIIEKSMMPSSRKRFQSVPELIAAIDNLQDQTLLDTGKEPVKEPEPAPVIPVPVAPEPPVASEPPVTPELPISSEPAPSVSGGPSASPAPSVSSEPDTFSPKTPFGGFPKWLYAVIAAIVVGLIVFLVIPRSKPVEETPAPDQPVPGQTVTPVPNPKPEPEPEPEPNIVSLTSISLSKTSLTLEEGATSTLTVKYTPADATDKSTTWKSTDTKVATVSNNGKVTAVKAGIAAIIATASGKESYCNVTVTAKSQPVQQQSATTTSSGSATGTINGHEWIDLGLSVKWATCNIGASSPSAYGDYYAWGETSTKSSYTWVNYRFRTSGDSDDNVKINKYNTQSDRGSVDNRTVLEMSDDVACQKWGGSWRMPTEKEFQELIDNCTWFWTTMNGVNGYKVTSKKSGYTDRSIFMPAAGWRYDTSLGNAGEVGSYWSSSLVSGVPSIAMELSFSSGDRRTSGAYRYGGDSVRPVCP
ncbi:MAG: protein kinase, partial [Bacteroidaceae bacterium]|nr:protein kinase [Bacteroidaceae bacterium]